MREDNRQLPHAPATAGASLGDLPQGAAALDGEGRYSTPAPVVVHPEWVIAAALLVLVLALPRSPIRSMLWGIVVLVSMIGWGTAIGSWLLPRRTLDRGLRAALGMALVVVLGGLLAVVQLVSITSSIAVVLAGLACLAWCEVRRTKAASSEGKVRSATRFHRRRASYVIATVGLALCYLISVGNSSFHPWDDNIAYIEFARQMLGSGTLLEPFSLRRIAALGGQTYLHAIGLAVGAIPNLHMVDDGIAVIILAGLVHGYSRRRLRSHEFGEMIALLLVVLFGLLFKRRNLASEFTGCVCFLGLLRVMKEEDDAGPRLGWRSASMLALFPAAAMTLRASNLVAAAVIPALGLYYFARQAPKADRWAWAVQACRIIFVTVLLLAPWWALSLRSCGTFLYPLVLGWGTPDFALFAPIPLVDRLRFVAFCVVTQGGFFFLAGAFTMTRRSQRIVKVFLLGGGIGALAIIWEIAPSDYSSGTARYHFPIVFPCLLGLCLELIPAFAIYRLRALVPSMLMARAIALLVSCPFVLLYVRIYKDPYMERSNGISYLVSRVRLAPAALCLKSSTFSDGRDDLYALLQDAVPPGARLLVLLDDPYRLDFRRNTIINFDLPGGVSPPPGIPIGRGPEVLARYFSSVSIRYIAFHISDLSPEYSIAMWRQRLAQPVTWGMNNRSAQLKSMARYYLDIFDNLKALSQTRRRLVDKNEHIVVDLGTTRPGS